MKTMQSLAKKVALASALLAASQCWSYTINSGATDVGNLDTLLGSVFSGPESALADFLNVDATDVDRYDDTNFYRVDGETSIYAIALNSLAEYFSIKKKSDTAAVFENTDSNSWGVFDVTGWGFDPNIKGSTGELSHHDEVGAAEVPEPGTLSLLFAGILGLIAARRRAKR